MRSAFTARRRQHRKQAQQMVEYSDDDSDSDDESLCTNSTCSSCYTQPSELISLSDSDY